VDLNKVIERVKAILISPKTTWPVIAEEPGAIGDIYKNYVVVLAAVSAIVTLIAYSVMGVHVPYLGSMRLGFGTALISAVKDFCVALVSVYVLALIVNALAPNFGGQKNMVQAVKAVAYSFTAGWLAVVGYLIPPLAMLILLAGGIYSIYLLYLGLPHTMKCPPERAGAYTAVTVVVAIVAGIVLALVLTPLTMRSSPFASTSHDTTPDLTFDKDSKLGKLEEYGRKMEEASQKLEEAQKSGDKGVQDAALQNMVGTVLGGGDGKPALEPARLKAFVPESLAGMKRSSFSSERNEAMGIQTSMARATYQDESGRAVNLQITDAGTAKGLFALAGWVGVESESETDSGYEKTYRADDRLIHEQWDKGSSQGEYTVVVGERFSVKVDGTAESLDDLKALIDDIDLSELEALQNEGA
jgi:Yip1 domain